MATRAGPPPGPAVNEARGHWSSHPASVGDTVGRQHHSGLSRVLSADMMSMQSKALVLARQKLGGSVLQEWEPGQGNPAHAGRGGCSCVRLWPKSADLRIP